MHFEKNPKNENKTHLAYLAPFAYVSPGRAHSHRARRLLVKPPRCLRATTTATRRCCHKRTAGWKEASGCSPGVSGGEEAKLWGKPCTRHIYPQIAKNDERSRIEQRQQIAGPISKSLSSLRPKIHRTRLSGGRHLRGRIALKVDIVVEGGRGSRPLALVRLLAADLGGRLAHLGVFDLEGRRRGRSDGTDPADGR